MDLLPFTRFLCFSALAQVCLCGTLLATPIVPIINENFETPPLTELLQIYYADVSVSLPSRTLPGQTRINSSGVYGESVDHMAGRLSEAWPFEGADGGNFVDLNGRQEGQLTYDLRNAVVPGQSYEFSFATAAFSGCWEEEATLSVLIVDGSTSYVIDWIYIKPTDRVTRESWQRYSYTFVPRSSNVRIYLTSHTYGAFGPMLDEILLMGPEGGGPPNGGEVAEPSTLILTGTVLLLLALVQNPFARRKLGRLSR